MTKTTDHPKPHPKPAKDTHDEHATKAADAERKRLDEEAAKARSED